MAIRKLLLLLFVCSLLTVNVESVLAGAPVPPQPNGFWTTTTAYQVAVAYWVGIEPHYGAFFSGGYGYNQHYLGPGGDAATCGSSSGCISNWNWWGNDFSVLLVPKSGWLWAELPGGPRWQGYNYQATVFIY